MLETVRRLCQCCCLPCSTGTRRHPTCSASVAASTKICSSALASLTRRRGTERCTGEAGMELGMHPGPGPRGVCVGSHSDPPRSQLLQGLGSPSPCTRSVHSEWKLLEVFSSPHCSVVLSWEPHVTQKGLPGRQEMLSPWPRWDDAFCSGTAKPSSWSPASTRASTLPSSSSPPAIASTPRCSCSRSVRPVLHWDPAGGCCRRRLSPDGSQSHIQA